MSGNINDSFKTNASSNEISQNNSEDDKNTSFHKKYNKTKNKQKLSDKCSHLPLTKDSFSSPQIHKREDDFTGYVSDSDTSDSVNYVLSDKKYIVKQKKLPPIGVFWDIENCRIPKGRSAVAVAQLIRDLFFTGYREAEFVVVCDVKKENSQCLQELSDAQVTLVHVSSTCKNAADEKLRQAMRRFADIHKAPAAVILISGDVNFASDLSDLRHRKKIHVILIHLENTADALILCASEHYSYSTLTQNLPLKEIKTTNVEPMEIVVRNLPQGFEAPKIKNRLKQISDNCGGKVVHVSPETCMAVVRFISFDVALRAQKRMDGEDVYGNKISVSFPTSVRNWDKPYSPYKYAGRRIVKNVNGDGYSHGNGAPLYMVPPQNSNQHMPLDYYANAASNQGFLDLSTGTIPKEYYNHYEVKKNYSTMNPLEGSRYVSKYQNPNMSMDLGGDTWRQGSYMMNDQKRSRSANDKPTNVWPGNNTSGSFNTLNITTSDDDFTFTPNLPSRSNSVSNSSSPVELIVTNIDQTLDPQELKRTLLSMFKEHVMVAGLNLFHQSDGSIAASVKVSSAQDAQYVISQLHRRKVGHKRVVISNAQSTSPNPHILRTQVIAVLQEVPENRVPLFKFREILESRYRTSVSISELYKLRDVCIITEEYGGRIISLAPEYRTTPQNFGSQLSIEVPHCLIHCPNGIEERGWAESTILSLPNVRYKLKDFKNKVQALLQSHMGTLPLTSFQICFETEIGEKMNIDDSGVPLEHLITCIEGVSIVQGINMVKYLVWGSKNGDDFCKSDENSNAGSMKCVSPPLATQLQLFSRELVDLLKTAPHCQLPFSRFIPAYHHHFGRQCRVADYGYTKLVDLFDALPHVVQGIGEGNKRFITLSHTAQIRRFTSDLLRVLKSQVSKQVILTEFPAAYERVLSRTFDPVDYGLCYIEDLLEEVSENTVVVKRIDNEIYIAIPKKEQTAEEIMKTKQFASEVVTLLSLSPQYGMLFNKFVPAYHHHFGHQCRVSDYGFTKLIELFEAIPDVVKIEETSDGERRVSLVPKEAIKIASDQITRIVKSTRQQSIPLQALPQMFLRTYGYALRPEVYECVEVDEIISKMPNSFQLVQCPGGIMVNIVEKSSNQNFGIKLFALLIEPPHKKKAFNLIQEFQMKYGISSNLQQIEKYHSIVQVEKISNEEADVCLTKLYIIAARLYHLLYEAGGSIYMGNIDGWYLRKYHEVLRSTDYGTPSLNALLAQLSFLLITRGKRNKKNVTLNLNIANYGIKLPNEMQNYANVEEVIANNAGVVNNSFQWPPPPVHTYLFSGRTTISPPKPDTPPTNNRRSLWDESFQNSGNLCIPLPPMQPLKLDFGQLISPMKSLLEADGNPLVIAPDPSQLPMPNAELLNKAKMSSPSKDSGISSSSITNSMEEPDSNTSFEIESKLTPTRKKRHMRLAAHFSNPFTEH